jgi:GNAT superfamily N-acetyltransferase
MRAVTVEIRPSQPGDGEALARVHERGWTITHARIADPTWVVERPLAERADQWEGYARGEGVPMWVADDEGEPVGLIAAGPARDDDAPPRTGEVYALYVDPDRQGEGIGGALLERAVEGLREAGHVRATLWTFGASAQSTGFYERHGWRRDGAEKDDRNLGAREVRYEREL